MKSIAAKKGVPGVLEEIALLEGDYAQAAVLRCAHRQRVARLLARASRARAGVSSACRRTTTGARFSSALSVAWLDQRSATAFVQVLDKMRSDYDRRLTLKTLFDSGSQFPDAEELYGVIALDAIELTTSVCVLSDDGAAIVVD